MSLFPAYISLTSTSNDDTQKTRTPSPTPSNQTGTYISIIITHKKNGNAANEPRKKIHKQK